MKIKQIITSIFLVLVSEGCVVKTNSQTRPEIEASINFVQERGDNSLDITSAKIINETGSYCDVFFTNSEAIKSGEFPQGEVFKVDKSSLKVVSYGAD